ncbi:uncharacterized protein LTR77_004888 [Saxophila tyrrhenica]|uniref:Uncharacterized protein n=1 Tax=Saxophila tyrrhenica TaxID=1690608 RepID=A0AAV9PAG6_9PEZI|nr:hypothetical protein LTR77_004888 [Saxophila tyrrhenica]
MAQKSQKTLATRNASTLNRTHLLSLAIHAFFHILRLVFRNRPSLLPYILLSAPSIIIEAYFERLSRPTYTTSEPRTLKRAGEDLQAPGLTEWMWDLLYWTWGCVVLVAVIGDRGWWAWVVVPGYSVWLAYGTLMGVKGGMGGLMGGAGAGDEEGKEGQSKRQAKMEKRGGQKTVYR